MNSPLGWCPGLFITSILLFSSPMLPPMQAAEPLSIRSAKVTPGRLEFTFHDPAATRDAHRHFIAVGFGEIGSAMVPYGKNQEGSTVFLPFQANQLIVFGNAEAARRVWNDWQWQAYEAPKDVTRMLEKDTATVSIPLPGDTPPKTVSVSIWRKGVDSPDGWGVMTAANDPLLVPGSGDKALAFFNEIDLTGEAPVVTRRARLTSAKRPVVYQLFVRHFSNTNETRKPHGTLVENGTGKFSGIDEKALTALAELQVTHVWLTGVLQQATGTDYSAIGAPADDPDLLKGVAGSPYAIKDYFDVSPDFADEPANRLAEFRALVERIRAKGMRTVIDFVPNHVARSHDSDVKPELAFGKKDDRSVFFAVNNHFFYLRGEPPLRLPTQEGEGRDGLFVGEMDHGKVTGNNVNSWTPGIGDWYETVKLNYGYDFVAGTRLFPSAQSPAAAVPDTWEKMDAVLAYWQELGVDGFRCDMAHMIPPEFWKWAIARARTRDATVWFAAEAYNNDPAKVPPAEPLQAGFDNVMQDLLDAGFDAVYDDPSYKTLKGIYESGRWANDLTYPNDYLFHHSLRYGENHDEVRLGSKGNWGEVGAQVGPAVAAVLFGASRGSIMLYNGQEYGEKAEGAEGFGGEDGRSSIFDYWSLPSLVAWWKDGLTPEQKALRARYVDLMQTVSQPPFTDGNFVALNALNGENTDYGRLSGESASGHWLHGCVRDNGKKAVALLVNLHPTETLRGVKVVLPGKSEKLEIGDIPAASWVVRVLRE